MKLGERLSRAVNLLLYGKFAYELMPAWEVGQPAYTNQTYESFVRHGYRKNELIYACITLKANSATVPTLRAHRKRDGEELPEHPLRRLIAKPNPQMSETDFHAANLITLDLAGRAYWEKQRSQAGKIVGLWPLRPDWLKPMKQLGVFIGGYRYEVPGVQAPTLLPADVLALRLWDPLDQYNGLAPVQVASRIGDVDNAATDFIKLFWEHGGMPMGVLTSKQRLVDAQVESIRARWRERYGGYRNWLEPAVLDSEAAYQRVGSTFKEMGFDELDGRSEARICMVLGTPPILVGAKVGLDRSTFANYQEARKAFWQETLMPQFRHIADALNADLAPEFGDDIELRWDFSKVPALQEDTNGRWDRAIRALQAGGITVNMFLEEIGQGTVGNGDIFLRSLTQQEVPLKRALGAKAHQHPHHAKVAGNAPDDDERRKRETHIERLVSTYLADQLERIDSEMGDGH